MCNKNNIPRLFMDTSNIVFTKLQFLFQVSKECQRIIAFFKRSCLMILVKISGYNRRAMNWHYAATAKAVMFLTFDIDVFIFTYLDTVQLR